MRLEKVANTILLGGGVVLLAVSCYLIYRDLVSERAPLPGPGALVRYLFPVVIAVALFVSVRLPRWKIELSLLIVSTVTTLYGVELCLGIPYISRKITRAVAAAKWTAAAKNSGLKFDTRSRLEVIDDLRAEGVDAYPVVPPTVMLKPRPDGTLKSDLSIDGVEVMPFAGVANRVTVLCNENGEYTIYMSDEHGFHNPKGLWSQRRMDIVTLGDSMTNGGCVPSDKGFVSVVRRRYPATLNLGTDNNGPLMMLAALKEYAQEFEPKIVLWFYFEGNDLGDLSRERRNELLMRYLGGEFRQHLRGRQALLDQSLKTYIEGVQERGRPRFELSRVAKLYHARSTLGSVVGTGVVANEIRAAMLGRGRGDRPSWPPEHSEVEVDLLGQIVGEAKSVVSRWNGVLYFVYLPELRRYSDGAIAGRDRDAVVKMVEGLGIRVIDVHNVFAAHRDPLSLFPFRRLVHYTEEGHRLVADEVLRSISLHR